MKSKKKVIWRITLLISIAVVAYLGIRAREVSTLIKQLDAQIMSAESTLMQEQEKLEQLKAERDHMNSLEYIEKIAREKLGMVKKDDIVFKEKWYNKSHK